MLDHGFLSKVLETTIVAARLAGQRAMEEMRYVKVSQKDGDQLVTQADTICQQLIIDRVKETFPDHGFIGEEGADGQLFKQPPRGESDFWWVIDPIDGTNNFAHGLLCFTVSIGVIHEGEPVVGVIFDPATESMFSAVKGGEAHLNGRRIQTSDETPSNFTHVGLDSHFEVPLPEWAAKLVATTRFRNLGTTALHLAYVSRGGMIAAVINEAKLWDIAAGALLVEAAGGKMTDWKGNRLFPVDMQNYSMENRFQILAANKKAHEVLLGWMQAST